MHMMAYLLLGKEKVPLQRVVSTLIGGGME